MSWNNNYQRGGRNRGGNNNNGRDYQRNAMSNRDDRSSSRGPRHHDHIPNFMIQKYYDAEDKEKKKEEKKKKKKDGIRLARRLRKVMNKNESSSDSSSDSDSSDSDSDAKSKRKKKRKKKTNDKKKKEAQKETLQQTTDLVAKMLADANVGVKRKTSSHDYKTEQKKFQKLMLEKNNEYNDKLKEAEEYKDKLKEKNEQYKKSQLAVLLHNKTINELNKSLIQMKDKLKDSKMTPIIDDDVTTDDNSDAEAEIEVVSSSKKDWTASAASKKKWTKYYKDLDKVAYFRTFNSVKKLFNTTSLIKDEYARLNIKEKHVNRGESWTTLTINTLWNKMDGAKKNKSKDEDDDGGDETNNDMSKSTEQESGELTPSEDMTD
jgi:hypothetical protein